MKTFEWFACFAGLLGSFLLATNSRISRWGWVAFSFANIAMLIYAYQIQSYGLMLQQAGFVLSSSLGLWRCGFFAWRWPESSTESVD